MRLRATARRADRQLLYLDSSALVKLVIEEAESADLEGHLSDDAVLATSRIAQVEVPRATRIANPSEDVQEETQRLLAACLLVDVSDRVLSDAVALASLEVRTLDAIHLATALYIDAEELVAYDRHLLEAAARHRLRVASPGPA
jgi:predicted nucleic acid-binding protein